MKTLRETPEFSQWMAGLRDRQAQMRIQARLLRLADGNPGQHRVLTHGVFELKIDYGPGYRVYCTEREGIVVILLIGGDKRTQQRDIRTAIELAKGL